MLKQDGKEDLALSKNIESIKTDLEACSTKLNDVQSSLKTFLLDVPNLFDDSVPSGMSEEDNLQIRIHGEPQISKGKRSSRDYIND